MTMIIIMIIIMIIMIIMFIMIIMIIMIIIQYSWYLHDDNIDQMQCGERFYIENKCLESSNIDEGWHP